VMSCRSAGDDRNHLKRPIRDDGLCDTCWKARRKRRRFQGRVGAVRRQFGWSEAELGALRDAQRRLYAADDRVRCPCGRPIDRTKEPAVDHDHAKERRGVPTRDTVRGLLCSNCNRFLGTIGDRPEALIALALHVIDPIAPKVLRQLDEP
jgi:hypothetical protein